MRKMNTAFVILMVSALAAMQGVASAQYVDPTGGSFDAATTDITDFITNTALPGLLTVAALGLVVAVAVKYLKRLRSAT